MDHLLLCRGSLKLSYRCRRKRQTVHNRWQDRNSIEMITAGAANFTHLKDRPICNASKCVRCFCPDKKKSLWKTLKIISWKSLVKHIWILNHFSFLHLTFPYQHKNTMHRSDYRMCQTHMFSVKILAQYIATVHLRKII